MFEPGLHAAALSQLHRQQELAHALAADQLVVHYQPVVDLAHGKTIGVEALVRWAHPDRGLIPPLGFIPLAEQTGLIIPLGAWVLEQACRQTRHWQQACPGYTGLGVSVNVSPVQLRDPEFLDTVTQSLARTALPAHTLTLEITESLLLADNAATTSMLHGLRALGVKLAVDDFGTGYSSLSYLRRLPIDILKVDRSFVSILEEHNGGALTRAVVAISRELGLRTIAEGVEGAGQQTQLQALGCDYAQGYYYCRPVPADQLEQHLTTTAPAPGVPAPRGSTQPATHPATTA